MKSTKPLFFLFLFILQSVQAVDLPQGSRFDNRIQFVNYNPDDVVVVKTLAGIATRIVFSENEIILDLGCGFTQGWEFAMEKNILYLKPRSVQAGEGENTMMVSPEAGKWDTNLMIKTSHRLYDFDIKLLSGNGNSERVPIERVSYRVQFLYPEVERQKLIASIEENIADSKLNTKAIPKNWSYTMQIGENSKNIAPTQAYDNGIFTYLEFPKNRDFPSVFLVGDDGEESIVNTHVDKDELVIHRVASKFVLRLGKSVIGVYNENYDSHGVSTTEGTTIDGLKRVMVGGQK